MRLLLDIYFRMKYEKNMKKNIPYLIFAFVIISVLIHQCNYETKMNDCNRITIATITGKSGGFSTAKTLNYVYKCDANVFFGADGEGIKDYDFFINFNVAEKKRFFVKYSCVDNNISKLIWNVSVPDTLKYIPADGWAKIPYNLSKI